MAEPKKKKKRGRKPKKKQGEPVEKPPPKKRGRKPKGGKIIKKNKKKANTVSHVPNIILHLKTSVKELEKSNEITKIQYQPELNNPISFSITKGKASELQYQELHLSQKKNNTSIESVNNNVKQNIQIKVNQPTHSNCSGSCSGKYTKNNMSDIWIKLNNLRNNLRYNNISDKNSSCFWDTCPFDSPPIHIPIQIRDDKIDVYGCFCSPECAVAYLKREKLDSSTMWHRYSLLNIIYGKIYNYEKNIKPAPDPHYTLDKYYGVFTINEWRNKLLNNDRLIMVVDKPLSKVLPEIYEENNEEPDITNNLIDKKYKQKSNKYKLKSKEVIKKKSDILKSSFGVY